MTLPYERVYAIENTRDFLRDLLNPSKTPKVPKKIRERAYYCLRHFPTEYDMELALSGDFKKVFCSFQGHNKKIK